MKQKELVILLLLTIITCKEDYYQLLGVQRNADQQTIKKAFKKLSLKYHPDKNKKNKEQAKNMFSKIVNAYEVLKDPKQKEVYDKHGEKGLEMLKRGQDPDNQGHFEGGGFGGGGFGGGGFDYDDFFGGGGFGGGGFGGGGQKFHFNMGGAHQEEEKKQEKHFENSDVLTLDLSQLSKFFRRENVWVILLFNQQKMRKKEWQELKETWIELGQKYYGIFQVAAVDCEYESELCEDEFQAEKMPEVQVLKANLDSEAYIYKGSLQVNRIAGYAVQFMDSFVSYVSHHNYQEFMARENDKPKVLLFTQKKSTPPLMKALSKEFKGKLVFGEVRASEEQLVKQLGVKVFPTLRVMAEGPQGTGSDYQGDYKKDQIAKFLREYAYAGGKTKRQFPDKVFQQVNQQILDKGQLGKNDNTLGLIILVESRQQQEQILSRLQGLLIKFKEQPVQFYCLVGKGDRVFPVTHLPAVVMAKTKRHRYVAMQQQYISYANVHTFVEDVLSGNRMFTPMADTLQALFQYKQEL